MSRVFLIAVGGPTSSGKTTLAKQLLKVLPVAHILHQDDYAPPSELIPVHPVHKVQDWDDPYGAIDWQRFYTSIDYIRNNHGNFHPDHHSHHHLNSQSGTVLISNNLMEHWHKFFASFENTKFIIVDGFQLYCVPSIAEMYDVKLFIRNDYKTLRARREDRDGYHTAVQSNAEGALWKDPPGYWDNIVWPAYIKGNKHLFKDDDIISGEILPQGPPHDEYPLHEFTPYDPSAPKKSTSSSVASLSSKQSSNFTLLDGNLLDDDRIFENACHVIASTLSHQNKLLLQ